MLDLQIMRDGVNDAAKDFDGVGQLNFAVPLIRRTEQGAFVTQFKTANDSLTVHEREQETAGRVMQALFHDEQIAVIDDRRHCIAGISGKKGGKRKANQ